MDKIELRKQALQHRKRNEKQLRVAGILGAAQAVFLKKGYHNATMDDIALAAGLSKPTLYRYFNGKGHLFFSFIEAIIDVIHEEISAIDRQLKSRDFKSGKAFIRAHFDALFRIYRKSPEAFRLVNLISESGDYKALNDRYRSIITEKMQVNVNEGRAVFSTAMRQGLIQRHDVEAIVDLIYGFFIGPIQAFHMSTQIQNGFSEPDAVDAALAHRIELVVDILGKGLSNTTILEEEGV
ncbi:MAG: TetR/AcrR family transcriptional regulator [Thermodesulfobacteriota bacterium]